MNKDYLELADKLVDKSVGENLSEIINRDIRRYSRKIIDTKEFAKWI